jgi:flagellar biosynthesis protein FlhG
VNHSSERRHRPSHLGVVAGHRPEPSPIEEIDSVAAPVRTITLLSGKGGVGKTNIAASLAIALGRQGRRVLLVDGDLALSSLDILMGVMPRHNAADLVAGSASLDDTLVESYAGVRVLPAASGDDELANLDDMRRHRLFRGLGNLGSRFDLVVIDAGSGVGRNVTSLAALGGENLVVTTPEPPAVSAAFSLLKILDGKGRANAPGLVVNQAEGSLEARECWSRISKACKQFLSASPEYLGWLPYDPAVPRAVRAREPFLLTDPAGPAAQAVLRLAQRVLRNDPVRGPEGAGRPVGARERLAG